MPSVQEFIESAATLSVDELITAGQQMAAIDAPGFLFDRVIDLIWDRDGEAEAERFCAAVFP